MRIETKVEIKSQWDMLDFKTKLILKLAIVAQLLGAILLLFAKN